MASYMASLLLAFSQRLFKEKNGWPDKMVLDKMVRTKWYQFL